MTSEPHLQVDARVLSDLRTSVLDLRKALAEAQKESEEHLTRIESVNEELESTRRQLEQELESTRRQLEQEHDARLWEAKQMDISLEKLRRAEEHEAELTEVLRQAQEGYWDTVRQLSGARSDLDRKDEALTTERERVEDLETQIERIKSSRAWGLITRYRRFAKRLKAFG